MPLPKGHEVFPAGYDELEAHVAGLCASVVFTGDPDAGDLSIAAFNRLFQEEIGKNPRVPPAAIAADILTFVERDMSIERVGFLGPPLRVAWFVLEYHAWVLIAQRCGRVRLEDDAVGGIRGKVLAALAELGVACTPQECDAEIERFVPRQSASKGQPPSTRDITYAAGIFVQSVRYLHLTALRHRSCVTPGFAEAALWVVAEEQDGPIAGEITRYLVMHRVDAFVEVARCREADRILALLSETSVAAPGFWAKVAEGRRLGLRPIALTLCARTRLDDLEASVPEAFRSDFEWLKATVVVEFQHDNMKGSISILRALEPTTKWWWRDDAIPWVIGTDPFSMFAAVSSRGASPAGSAKPYPAVAQYNDVAEAFRLARIGADAIVAQQDRVPGGEWTREKTYLETCNGLLVSRRTFPEGYFRLPWFLVAYHAMLRILLSSPAYGQRTAWKGMDFEFFQQALFSLGIGSRLADVPTTFGEFLDLPWPHGVGHHEGALERARGFVALVRALSEVALDCQRKVRLQFPLFSSFVSYARADRDLARELVTAIEGWDVADVWWDQNSIAMGGALTETLREAIASSERFVLIASKASAANRYVQLELGAALKNEKPIIIVCPDNEICPEWRSKVGEMHAEGRLAGQLHCSGDGVEPYGPALVAALTRNRVERHAWLAGRPSSFWPD